jgi:LCP family protein required for cell wall assembly
MSPRRKTVLFLTTLGLASALVWPLVGGMTVASGQEKPIVIHRAHSGSFRHAFTKPIFILGLGSDAGAPKYGRGGGITSGRADSIHIIAINPALKKATIVGIPRDSYVDLACGGKNKINAGMLSGVQCMVDTVEAMSGGRLKFDYYMAGSFESLEKMINDLGGVPVDVERGLGSSRRVLQDHASRARGIRTGKTILKGPQALAYSRDRHDYGRGDFDRTVHQGQVMMGALTKARTLVEANPGKTLTFLRSIFRNVRLDIPLVEAFRLGLMALEISPSDVKNTFLDGTTGTTSAGSSVLLFNPQPLLANVADDAIIN